MAQKQQRGYSGFMFRKQSAPSIAVDGDVVRLDGAKPGMQPISLGDVEEVTFFKRDEITTDLVCCEIRVDANDGPIWFFHEETVGFDKLVTFLERLPAFDLRWRDKVMLPPFAENRTVAFRRVR